MRTAFIPFLLALPLFAQEPASVPPTSDSSSDSAAALKPVTMAKTAAPVAVENSTFKKLTLGGSLQLKAFYHNFDNDDDQKKKLSASVSKFRVDLEGAYNEHFGLLGQFLLEANGRKLGIENAYAYAQDGSYQLKAGKLKKPFSMEALQSSTSLYTVDRGQLYNVFLNTTTGYAMYDVGLTLKGGFTEEGTEITYEAGVFNGKQSDTAHDYSGAQYVGVDKGFQAKDFAGRVALKGFQGLEAELAFSTKTAEVLNGAGNLDLHADAAYEAGLAYERKGIRAQGEVAWGANHDGRDSNIIDGSSKFLAFYTMLVWKHNYSGGRASEAVLKWEGLDPTVTYGNSEDPLKKNDGKFLYTVGVNYFFTPKISLLTDYSLLQPVTKEVGEGKLVNNLDLMWRLNF